MCQDRKDPKATKRARRRWRRLKVWKWVQVRAKWNGKTTAESVCFYHRWLPGHNIAVMMDTLEYSEHDLGFHFYLRRRDAMAAGGRWRDWVLLQATVCPKDVRSIGWGDGLGGDNTRTLVATAATVSKREYARVLREGAKP